MPNENGHRGPNPDIPAGVTTGPSTQSSIEDGAAASSGSLPAAKVRDGIVLPNRNFPRTLGDNVEVFKGADGNAYLRQLDDPRRPVLRIGSKTCDAFLRRIARSQDKVPRTADLRELNEHLVAYAELAEDVRPVFYRIAPVDGGFEIDLGDVVGTRIRVTGAGAKVLSSGSESLFIRTPRMQPMVLPAETGDLRKLDRYLNLESMERFLLTAWILYTLAHPKLPTTVFPILVLIGGQGTGKSVLGRMISSLIDPNAVGLRTFPKAERDLAIAAQQSHLLLFDNLRAITPAMSDLLCIAATGGAYSTRRLYTDAEEVDLQLHVPIVLNGIAPVIDQPDLAQRCLPLTLLPLEAGARRDEAALFREFADDLPGIFRGAIDRIAGILANLEGAEVVHPERVLGFTRWLAAMERLDDAGAGTYQAVYSDCVKAGMLDTLETHPLGRAVLSFVDGKARSDWSGPPKKLLEELEHINDWRDVRHPEWPQNEIALSKRLLTMQASLARQGIEVKVWRSHERMISLTRRPGGAS